MPARPPRYLIVLSLLFLVWAGALAIKPLYRADWALENVLVVAGLVVLVLTYRRFQFSPLSYTLIFVFLCIHEIGSHYTYAQVPYDRWAEKLFGHTINDLFGWDRNHFDRLVHLLYGLLLAIPARELAQQVVKVRGIWTYLLPVGFAMASSLFFELLEWAAASSFGGDLGMAYLGTQGDEWDSHKDSLMALIGAVVTMVITAVVEARRPR